MSVRLFTAALLTASSAGGVALAQTASADTQVEIRATSIDNCNLTVGTVTSTVGTVTGTQVDLGTGFFNDAAAVVGAEIRSPITSMCNYAARITLEAERGGLKRTLPAAWQDLGGAAFVNSIGYTATYALGAGTATLVVSDDVQNPPSPATALTGGPAVSNGDLVITIPAGTLPVASGVYEDVVILTLGPDA